MTAGGSPATTTAAASSWEPGVMTVTAARVARPSRAVAAVSTITGRWAGKGGGGTGPIGGRRAAASAPAPREPDQSRPTATARVGRTGAGSHPAGARPGTVRQPSPGVSRVSAPVAGRRDTFLPAGGARGGRLDEPDDELPRQRHRAGADLADAGRLPGGDHDRRLDVVPGGGRRRKGPGDRAEPHVGGRARRGAGGQAGGQVHRDPLAADLTQSGEGPVEAGGRRRVDDLVRAQPVQRPPRHPVGQGRRRGAEVGRVQHAPRSGPAGYAASGTAPGCTGWAPAASRRPPPGRGRCRGAGRRGRRCGR